MLTETACLSSRTSGTSFSTQPHQYIERRAESRSHAGQRLCRAGFDATLDLGKIAHGDSRFGGKVTQREAKMIPEYNRGTLAANHGKRHLMRDAIDLPPIERSTSRVSFPVKGRRRTHHEAEAIH